MKNDIKTKSTDFLPQKPGLSGTVNAIPASDAPTSAPATPVNDLPPGAPAPSKHVIDLKNTTSNSASPQESSGSVASNNPFLQGKKSPQDLKVEPAPAVAPAEPAQPDTKTTDMAAADTSKEESSVQITSTTDDTKKAEPGTAPSMDLAHPESDQSATEKDSLKDAMVSDDATAKKPKKKLPTWLMVIIIVVAVVVIGIITFAVLNAVARPTGL